MPAHRARRAPCRNSARGSHRRPSRGCSSKIGIDQRLEPARAAGSPVRRRERQATVRLGDYFGKRPVLLALVYYECPMLCTQVLNGVTGALKVLNFDVGQANSTSSR